MKPARRSRLWALLLSWPLQVAASYEDGIDAYTRNDYLGAFKVLLPLAQTGDPRAQNILGMMYRHGEGVPPDDVAAFHWFLAAAKQGYGPAEISTAEMYDQGRGTAADPRQALAWARRAADKGIERAVALADRLAEETPRQDDGSRPSRQWKLDIPTEPVRPVQRNTASPQKQGTTASGTWRVQLGAMRSRAAAQRLWERVRAPFPGLLGSLVPTYPENAGEQGLLVRVQVGSFQSFKEANGFCSRLTEQGLKTGCLPVKPATNSTSPAAGP